MHPRDTAFPHRQATPSIPARAAPRFIALDSWRGLSACAVVLQHSVFSINHHLTNVDAVLHLYLFVDFFFVLSGFVIAANYENRLTEGFGIGRYMALRMARILPLHAAVLVAFLVFRLLGAIEDIPVREDDGYSVVAFVRQLLLLDSLGLAHQANWNHPSWSISAEVFTYLIFALLWQSFPRTWRLIACALIAALPIVILVASPSNMATTHSFGLLRCVYGFSCGTLLWHAYQALERTNLRPGVIVATLAELVLLASILAFIKVVGSTGPSVLAPLAFAPLVLTFAFERGLVSRALRLGPFALLGALSYSIYMVHVLILEVFQGCMLALDASRNALMAPSQRMPDRMAFGVEPWMGDVAALSLFALVIAVSWLTYTLIERPAQAWGRRRIAAAFAWKPGSAIHGSAHG